MSWMATERFEARTAPGGLALVQELVNTHAVARHGADLLADLATARHWLRAAAGQWAQAHGLEPPELFLPEKDLDALRELRTTLQEMLVVPSGERFTGPFDATGAVLPRARALLVADERGRVAVIPAGTGASWLASAVWSEILLAQHDGAWSHLKLCRGPRCRTAFYDASRNGSAVWHNVRTCGNIANLRASRARRKGAGQGPDE
ncbi:CGNR zinc finger domain-containing protein [Microbispora corallina]|nr:CGNR zinc finger domain-containing protein [Microbispora corallina]